MKIDYSKGKSLE